MGYRIFITGSGIAAEAQQLLRDSNCEFAVGEPKDTPEEIAVKVRDFQPHALIVRQGKITGAVMDASEHLKVICKHGVGTDNIDIAAATERSVPVFFTPDANFESTAEHTLAMLLSLARQIPAQDRQIRNGIFDKKQYGGLELTGKTLGLIGFGKIARRLAELVAPFNMSVWVYHPSGKMENLPEYIRKAASPEDVFATADFISLHCPLTPKTRNLINEQSMAMMKNGVCIVNVARGGIINESDLLAALGSGKVRGAALDVFETEPPAMDDPLFKLDNVIVTAHVGGASDNSMKNMGLDAIKNIFSVLNSGEIDQKSLVNPEVFGK